jgi:hypothetical protein
VTPAHRRHSYHFQIENLKGRYLLGDAGIDERIILKWNFKKRCVMCKLNLTDIEEMGCYEHGNEYLVSVNRAPPPISLAKKFQVFH